MSNLPGHINSIVQNRREIERLLEIHSQIAGSSPGKKHDVEVLNKSSIVLLVACWEAYIEDLADAAFDHLLANARSPQQIPNKVLTMASKSLRSDQDELRVWDLAQDGWKSVLQDHREAVKDKYTGKLNTPRPKQIDLIFEQMLGLKAVSSKWNWQGASNENVIKRLEDLVTLRGQIAHRVSTSESVKKFQVEQNVTLIGYLSTKLSNQVRQHLQTVTRRTPWSSIRYKSVA